MKKTLFILILLGVVVSVASAQVLDKTIARVKLYKTEIVTQSKLDQQVEIWRKTTGQQEPDLETKKTILTATINDILISQSAEKEGIIATTQQVNEAINQQKLALGTPISDDDLKELIVAQTGIPWEEYRKQIRNRIVQEQYIYKKYGDEINSFQSPTDAQIEEAYNTYENEFINPSMVRVSHIFWEFSTRNKDEQRKKAEEIAKIIANSPQKFDEYEELSLDDPSYEAGDLGYLVRDQNSYNILGENFVKKVFGMKEGEVSGLMISNAGYHIVKVVDKRDKRFLQLDDPIFPGERTTVRDRLTALLSNQNQQERMLSLVKDEVENLRSKADIKILEKEYR